MDDSSADVALSASGLMLMHAEVTVGARFRKCVGGNPRDDAAAAVAAAAAAADLCDRAAGACLQIMRTRSPDNNRCVD